MSKETYCIVRFYQNAGSETIERGLTREEAVEHCKDPETSSRTCSPETARSLDLVGKNWFDGFEREV